MAEEAKQNEQQADQQKAQAPQAGSSGGLMKYLLLGGVGMVVAVVVAVGVAFLLKDSSPEMSEAGHDESTTEAPAKPGEGDHQVTEQSHKENESESADDDYGLSDEDASAIDKIMENLAFLDYEPDDSEILQDEDGMSVEDSIEQVNWLEKEKETLAAREKELAARQKELDRLEQQVNKKLLNVEQVESSRTAQLAKLYDGMDSRSVAQLLANLDDKTVVSILPRMKVKNASAVLQLMPPQRAAKLSKQMISLADN